MNYNLKILNLRKQTWGPNDILHLIFIKKIIILLKKFVWSRGAMAPTSL